MKPHGKLNTLFAAAIAVSMCAGLCACGNGSGSSAAEPAKKATADQATLYSSQEHRKIIIDTDTGADDASAAVVNQDLFAAELPDQGGNLCFRAFAEDHLGGRVVIESKHCFPSRLCMMKLNRNLTETMIKLRVNFKSRAFLTVSKDRPETVVSGRDIQL